MSRKSRMQCLICFLAYSGMSGQVRHQASAAVMHQDVPSADYEMLADPFQSVGWIRTFDSAGQPTSGGSGVLIHPNWVLTAAHVVAQGDAGPPHASFTFGLGNDIDDNPGEFRSADAWCSHPAWNGNYFYGTDLALLYFEDGFSSAEPAERFRGEDPSESETTMVGFGVPGFAVPGSFYTVNWLEPDYKKRAAMATTEDGTSIDHSETTTFWWLGLPSVYNAKPLGGQGSPGDSGGGWFSEIDGRQQLTAITSSWIGGFGYGGRNGATRVSYFNDWIDSYVIPEPTTLLLLLLGGAPLLQKRT